MPPVVVSVVVGYLLGSIPVADLVTRRRGSPDLRDIGDGNPGYWNARSTMGRRAALPVLLGDVAKGALAAAVGRWLGTDWWVGYLAGLAAMVGHAFPLFAGFRGGRSVLTFVGAMIVLAPVPAAIAIGLCIGVTAATRRFEYGARAGVLALPFVQLALEGPYRTAMTGVLMTFIGMRFAQAALTARRAGQA